MSKNDKQTSAAALGSSAAFDAVKRYGWYGEITAALRKADPFMALTDTQVDGIASVLSGHIKQTVARIEAGRAGGE